MQQANYLKELEYRIGEFKNVSMSGTKNILSWFYDNMDSIDIFEVPEYASTLFNILSAIGFKENVPTPNEELNCINRLYSKSMDNSSEVNGTLIISLIMESLKNEERLSMECKHLIEMYNEKYNKDKIIPDMMDKLSNHLGDEVTLVAILNGKNKIITGILKDVEPYKTVTIDKERYPFIGYHVGIIKITSNFGKMLYNNSYISSKDNLEDFSVIEKKNEELFGNNYKEALNKIY